MHVSLYEVEQCAKALHELDNKIEMIFPNILGGKIFKNSLV